METKLSGRQALALALTAVSSPIIHTAVSRTTSASGKSAWLAGVFAAVLAGVFMLMLCSALRFEGVDLLDAMCAAFGNGAGKTVAVAYALFILFIASLGLREYAERFVSTIFPGGSVAVFAGVMLLLALFAASRPAAPLGRSSVLFIWAILVIAVGVTAFSLGEVKAGNVLPVTLSSAEKALGGVLPIMNCFTVPVHLSFLAGDVRREKGFGKALAISAAAVSLLLGVIIFAAVGSFGEKYTAENSVMFFTMAKSVRIFDAAQHVESVVVAAWVVSDFVLISAEIMSACRVFIRVFPKVRGKFFLWGAAIALFAVSMTVVGGSFDIEKQIAPVSVPLNVGVSFALVTIIWAAGKMAKNKLKNFEKSS